MNKQKLVRYGVILVVSSISVVALVGIIVLLSGSFGEVEGKILLSSLVVTGYSLTSLAGLRNFDSKNTYYRFVAVACMLCSLAGIIAAIPFVWTDYNYRTWDYLRHIFALAIVTFSLAHISLLIPLMRSVPHVRGITKATFICILATVFIWISLIYSSGSDTDAAVRLLGVGMILCALGTIAAPTLHRFRKRL